MLPTGDIGPHVALRRCVATPTESQVIDITQLHFGSDTNAKKAVAEVGAAYERVEKTQSKLSPAANDRERLERLVEMDQAGRAVLMGPLWSAVPKGEYAIAEGSAFETVTRHDLANQVALKAMLPKEGWFPISKYGRKASVGAFLIVQHAVNDPSLMHTALARMQPLVAKGEVTGSNFALLYDRIALDFDHKQQRYGSQISCKDGHPEAVDLEDPKKVDERRKSVGLKQTEKQYLQNFTYMRCR